MTIEGLKIIDPARFERSNHTLLVLDESGITCNRLPALLHLIRESGSPVILALPEKQLERGKRGYAKSQILMVAEPNIAGFIPLKIQDVENELSLAWLNSELIGPLNFTEENIVYGLPREISEQIAISDDRFDQEMIRLAYDQVAESNCWMDPAGCVFVLDGELIMQAHSTNYNDFACTDLPLEYSDLSVNSGERMLFCDSLHAERVGVANAAKKCISLSGSSIYLTKFPCRSCAMELVSVGVRKIYFDQGSYGLTEATDLLETNKVDLIKVARV